MTDEERQALQLRKLDSCYKMLIATVNDLDRVRNVKHRSEVEQAELEFLLEIGQPIEMKYAEIWDSIELS